MRHFKIEPGKSVLNGRISTLSEINKTMKFNPDRINIHELAIEEPEKQPEPHFDVERDITPEDWQGMRDML